MNGHILHFSVIDYAVIGLFLALILALGFSAKLRDNSVLQFITAGRSLTLPVFVATLVSTWYGGILGIGESVSYYGFGTWLLFGVPYYVFALIYALWLAKKVREVDQISIPERLAMRWGKTAGLIGAILVFLMAVPAAHVLMLGILAQGLTGWGIVPSVIVACLVGTAFLYKGGLLADVRVGMLAFVMMYVGFAVMLLWCLANYPLGETLAKIEPKSFLTLTGGQGPIAIVSFFILGAWTLVDPGFHQRVASAKDPQTGQKGVFVSIGFWFLFDMLSIGTGLYAFALLKSPPESGLHLFPAFGEQVLPSGLKAIFFCGMLGTILSAMVGYTLVGGATVGREFVARLKNWADDSRIKLWTRVGFALACLVAVVLALEIDSVVNLWYQWGGCVIGALLIPVVMGYLGKKDTIHRNWIVASMVIAFIGAFSWLIFAYRTNNAYLNVAVLDGRWFLPTDADVNAGKLGSATVVGLGTLAPGLVISACVIGLGKLTGWRTGKHG